LAYKQTKYGLLLRSSLKLARLEQFDQRLDQLLTYDEIFIILPLKQPS